MIVELVDLEVVLQTQVERIEHILACRNFRRAKHVVMTEECVNIMLVEQRYRLADLNAEVHTCVESEVSSRREIHEVMMIVLVRIEVCIILVAFATIDTKSRTQHQVHIK